MFKFRVGQTVKIIELKKGRYSSSLSPDFLNRKVVITHQEKLGSDIVYMCDARIPGYDNIIVHQFQIRALRKVTSTKATPSKPITLADEIDWMGKVQQNFKQPRDEMFGRYGSLDDTRITVDTETSGLSGMFRTRMVEDDRPEMPRRTNPIPTPIAPGETVRVNYFDAEASLDEAETLGNAYEGGEDEQPS